MCSSSFSTSSFASANCDMIIAATEIPAPTGPANSPITPVSKPATDQLCFF